MLQLLIYLEIKQVAARISPIFMSCGDEVGSNSHHMSSLSLLWPCSDLKGCFFQECFLFLFELFLFFSLGPFYLIFATFWNKKLYFLEFWSQNLPCALFIDFSMVLVGFSMVFIDLPKVFINCSILFIQLSMVSIDFSMVSIDFSMHNMHLVNMQNIG